MACGSTKKKDDCISESRKNLIISWGDYDMKNNRLIRGYAIKTDRTIHQLHNLHDSISSEVIAKTDDTTYCEMTSMLWNTILTVQKLNVPADTVRFVRYSNPSTGYQLNGFWNNRYKAIGSKEYREVFDILNSISPIKFEK
jgi:hypothetical protein